MTEDDTFKRLKRIPLKEMREIFMNDSQAFTVGYTDRLFEKCGWTIEEYLIEWRKYNEYQRRLI